MDVVVKPRVWHLAVTVLIIKKANNTIGELQDTMHGDTWQSQGSCILKHTCSIIYFTLNITMIYKMNIMSSESLETTDLVHKLCMKMFTEVTN